MENVNEILNNYYSNYDEDARLTKDRSHHIEFITTVNYIDKYLKSGDRILEVGAGTGRYSLYYASKGYKVNSIELIDSNIDIFKTKIKDDMDINVEQGNALDLSRFEDNTFDVTLVLGPLYHLFTKVDKEKAISEAIRVTKKGGIIYFAHITNDAVIVSYGLRKGNLLKIPELVDENYKVKDIPEEIFSANLVDEFNCLMEKFDVKFLHNVATDGISNHLAEYVNKLTDEEYDIWVKYHLSTAERKDLLGHSSHILYICTKN